MQPITRAMRHGMVLVLLGVMLATPLTGVATPGDNGGPGNSGAAKQCQHDGWQNSVRDDLSGFVSQGDCVRHGAQGGGIHTPSILVTWYYEDWMQCSVSIWVFGFPEGTYPVGFVGVGSLDQLMEVSSTGGGVVYGASVVDASSGERIELPHGATFQAFVGSLESTPTTASCQGGA